MRVHGRRDATRAHTHTHARPTHEKPLRGRFASAPRQLRKTSLTPPLPSRSKYSCSGSKCKKVAESFGGFKKFS